MTDTNKFREMAEIRTAQYDECLRKFEPLTRNYDFEPADAEELIQYMREGLARLEALFLSSGKRGGFRFRKTPDPFASLQTPTKITDQDVGVIPKTTPDPFTPTRSTKRT